MISRKYMDITCPVSCKGKIPVNVDPSKCTDYHERCAMWADVDLGNCDSNPDMRKYCRKSCKFCGDEAEAKCVDIDERCTFWSETGECEKNAVWMRQNCPLACNSCAEVADAPLPPVNEDEKVMEESKKYGERQVAEGSLMQKTLATIRETSKYMESDAVTSLPVTDRENCLNRHELCSFWATLEPESECVKNKAFMTTNCGPACQTCHLLDIKARCPLNKTAVPALLPGDLNKMFERIIATAPGNRTLTEQEIKQLEEEKMPVYSVNVLSQPNSKSSDDVSVLTDKSLPPWVVTFDNFITPEECEELIELGYEFGYKRSEDVGKIKFDGSHDSVKSERRTSENAWCSGFSGCRQRELPKRIHDRIAKVTGIPPENSEDFQILRYEKGQFYRTHHDFIPHQVDRQCGPRILTFFLYLSEVEGGGTDFPELGITVQPKVGKAVLWPSVLNASPMKKDGRFMHQALDVESGVKFGANAWIHMYDYQTPQSTGCN